MPYCNQCQLVHGEEHRFCQRCGQLLKGSPAAAARPCARCGDSTFPGQKFCTECGLPLRTARVIQEEEEAAARPPLFYPRRNNNVPRRRQRRPGRLLSLLGLIIVIIAGVYLWRLLPVRVPATHTPAVTVPKDELRSDVEKLAEKIRSAHLNKDIHKWLSCYSSSYPNLGLLESQMLELWKNYDVKDVNYRIANVQRQSDTQATADLSWNIQLYNQRTHDFDLIRRSYKITLQKSGAEWKIVDSKEESGGPS